jgi:excisionase family DNA binding protein
MTSNDAPFLSAKQVARVFGIAERTVQAWAAAGILPAVRLNRLWRFQPHALDDVLRRKNTNKVSSQKRRHRKSSRRD